jgi:hypothetical protein
LVAALGSEPTAQELWSPAGRYDATALMYEREQVHLSLGRGLGAVFTEIDETMVAAGREFAAQWLVLRDRMPHEMTTIEFAALSALHDRFNSRTEEFSEAVNKIGEIAGIIAAMVARHHRGRSDRRGDGSGGDRGCGGGRRGARRDPRDDRGRLQHGGIRGRDAFLGALDAPWSARRSAPAAP